MGLGKTISVIGALNALTMDHSPNFDDNCNDETSKTKEKGQRQRQESIPVKMMKKKKVLIVAPKSVLPNWESELNRWLLDYPPSIEVITARSGVPALSSAAPYNGKDAQGHAPNIFLINYEIVDKYRDDIDRLGAFDVVVCDEAHYLKNADSLRSQATLGHYYTNRTGINTQRLWLLTGSPVLNNPIELFPLLRALDPKCEVFPELKTLHAFRERYCGKQVTPWGITYKGGKNLDELRHRLVATPRPSDGTPIMLRRLKDDVLQDLPTKRHQLLPLDDAGGKIAAEEARVLMEAISLAKKKKKNYDWDYDYGEVQQRQQTVFALRRLKVVDLKAMLKEHGLPISGRKKELIQRLAQATISTTTWEEDSEIDVSCNSTNDGLAVAATRLHENAISVLRSAPSENRNKVLQSLLGSTGYSNHAITAALSKARHATALCKLPYAIELLETATASHKVVVYAYHRDVQQELFEAFEDRAVAINGDSTFEERADAVYRFQNDPSITLFVGSIRAAGVGITLTAASHVLFVELDWSPSVIKQAEDRCHRFGQESSVLVQYLFFRNTIDEYISQMLASKQTTIMAATDEPKGNAAWVFDFGKHQGRSVWDVAASHSGYLKWLVSNDAYQKKEELTSALLELGFLNLDSKGQVVKTAAPRIQKDSDDDVVSKDSLSREQSDGDSKATVKDDDMETGGYILTFGKHKGKPIGEVPRNYLWWVASSGAARRDYKLSAAIRRYLFRKKPKAMKSKATK